MNSNSYLGMALRSEVIEAEEGGRRQYGTGPGAVRFISGTWSPHVALERRLAAFHGRPAAMLFSSAYATVMGLVPPLVTDKTAVISDALNHNCIINAIALARPAEKHIYKHLDMGELERALEAASKNCTRAIVVTDGIFSMRGDHAPLDRIMTLARAYDDAFAENVIVVVDDSHGVGAFGATGRGTEEYTKSGARRSAGRDARQGVRRQWRLRRRRGDDHPLPARDVAVLHLFESDHAGGGGRRPQGGRHPRQPGRRRDARASARDDGALQGRPDQARL